MIIGKDRPAVIQNIKAAAERGDFHSKVELGDPSLTHGEAKQIADRYLTSRKKLGYRLKCFVARLIANIGGSIINRDTEIVGEIDADILRGGIMITSNHFSPIENTIIRDFVRKNGKKRLNVLSQITNFAMGGIIGFLMNYTDTIPLFTDARYIARDLVDILREKIDDGEAVLIYPEQEMWFNYRKPRPLKPGAYHFAAKLSCPILSCFVEIIDKNDLETSDFYKVRYRLHLLGVIYPDKSKTVKENCADMCEEDYRLKKEAYERIYQKPLDYKFESSDIAGWIDYEWVLRDEQ